MTEVIYERDVLLNDLRRNVIEVHFTKVNGEERVMRCTLMPDALPAQYRESNEDRALERKFHSENPTSIAAWDIDKNAWRSFRVESVSYCQAIPYF